MTAAGREPARGGRHAYNRADGRACGGGDRRWHRHWPGGGRDPGRQGDRVAILGRRPEVLKATAGELGCAWRQADVTVREQVQAAVDWVVAELGPGIDMLVNNAGGIGALDDDAPLEEAERV